MTLPGMISRIVVLSFRAEILKSIVCLEHDSSNSANGSLR